MTRYVGIDLSGPANLRDTAVVVCDEAGEGLTLCDHFSGVGDALIFRMVEGWLAHDDLVVAIDAPLSYNPGGGDRPGDKALRQLLSQRGLAPGSVMAPTMNRMAYLTLRGMAVARGIVAVGQARARVVEVHPGAAMLLRGAPADTVKRMKRDAAARGDLLAWLEAQNLMGVLTHDDPSDHYVAACGAVLGGWAWARGAAVWREAATPPLHPFDFAV